ncbi:hypothetical protein AB6A40_001957, partial [Gnathostoma spinigerum]
ADQRRDRSAASRDALHDIPRDALRTPPHIARITASIPAPPPGRKLSEPLLNGRPEDLDVLATELTRIGRQQQKNSSSSPPPPAPPPRDTSMMGSEEPTSPTDGTLLASETARVPVRELDASNGTLRGPNKPLPPTPSDQSPSSDTPPEDGTLLIAHRRNASGSDLVRRCNGDSGSRNRLSQMVKAASMPEQAPLATEAEAGSNESTSSCGGSSSPESSPPDLRKNPSHASTSAVSGSRCGVMPDLLPKTPPTDRVAAPQLSFIKEQSLASVDSQSIEEHPPSFTVALKGKSPLSARDRERSFVGYFNPGMSSGGTVNRPGRAQDANQVEVNVNPNPVTGINGTHLDGDAPEIRKYKKKFSADILCAALWGVNLLIGTDSGLMLLDRSGQGKVYQLITRRRFEQMTVLEGQNILVTISGRKRRIRVYYLSWLKQKILRTEGVSGTEQIEKRNGWVNVGDLQGAVHFKIVRYERIKFLVVGLESAVEIYAWAPKPYHKFMAFKAFGSLAHLPLVVDLTVEENARLKVLYGSREGFHAIDLDSGSIDDIYTPPNSETVVTPHCIVILPNSNGMQLLLCYNNEGVYVSTYGKPTKNVFLQWGETPSSVAYISTGQIMGWGNKAIEIRSVDTGHLDGVFMHKKAQKLKFLCERNDKVFFSSAKGGGACQIYFMTLNKPGLLNW